MKNRLRLALLAAALVVCVVVAVWRTAQPQGSGINSYQNLVFTQTGAGVSIQQNSTIKYHQIIWTTTGTVATCTVTLDTSPDGVTWTTGGMITAQTCTPNGQSSVTGLAQANYLRINVSTLSGGGSVQIVYVGWAYNPTGGGITVVGTAPSGSCTAGSQPQMVSSTGVIYTCQNGTWGSILTAGGAITAANFGVVAEGHYSFNCSAANTSSSITCTDGNFTTNAQSGNVTAIYCTSRTTLGGNAGDITLAEGTIITVNSATNVTVTTTTSSGSTAFCLWGQYEDTALSNFETAVIGACTMGQLPTQNAEGNGPAVILIKHKHFYQPSICAGTGSARNGFGYFGGGMLASMIAIMPSVVTTDFVNGACSCALFGGASDGGWFHDFTFFGGGVSTIAGLTTKTLFQMNPGNNSYMDNMYFLAFGAGPTNNGLGICVEFDGQVIARGITEDYCGDVGIKTGNSGLGATTLSNITAQDNKACNIWIAGQGSTNVVLLANSTTGQAPATGGASLCVANATSAAIVYVTNSQIGNFGSVGSSGEALSVGKAVPLGTTVNGTGTLIISNSTVGLAANNAGIAMFNSGSVVHMQGTTVRGSQTLFGATGSSFFDDGGNNVAGTTVFNGVGNLFGHSLSITGTTQTTGNWSLTGWGTSPTVTACSGDSLRQVCTITVGTTPSANPTVAITNPTAFWAAPNCLMQMISGTAGFANFTYTVAPTTTSGGTWQYNGTPGAGTVIAELTCSN